MLKEIITATIMAYAPIVAQSNDSGVTSKENKISIAAETGSSSRYVFRGMQFGENSTLENSVDASIKGFTATVYNNYSPDDKHVNKWDFILEYEKSIFNALNVKVGTNYLIYPNSKESKGLEISTELEFKYFIRPSILFVKDIINKGTYASFSINTGTELFKGWNFNVNMGIGYNDKYFRDKKGLSHFETGLSLEVPILENLSGTLSATQITGEPKNKLIFSNIKLRYEF